MRAFFFNGVRLWEQGEEWHTSASRGARSDGIGVDQMHGYINPASPNWSRQVSVTTFIGLVTAYGDLSRADTLDAMLHQLESRLIAQSKTLGNLSRCTDSDRRAVVTGGPYAANEAAQPVSLGAPGGGWAPAQDRLVLLRNPTTGDGFVTPITAIPIAGSISVVLPVQVTSAWEAVDVVAYFPSVQFDGLRPGVASPDDRTDEWRPSVEFAFTASADPVYAAAHLVPMDT